MAKKRHHFIPKAYLKTFCNEEGKVHVYRKHDPGRVIHQSPDGIGFHKYFYSQPVPDGGFDHEQLENLFSEFETKWPPIVERLQRKECVNDSLEAIFAFIALQRARVPAARDACEVMLANLVQSELRLLKAAGELPAPPKGMEQILEHVEVAIDPHQSIHAMVDVIRGTGEIFDRIGIVALHNTTNIPFLTSDNPVIWFDPSVRELEMRPYTVRKGGPIALLFPVAPDLMIYGNSSLWDEFSRHSLEYREPTGPDAVTAMNRHICRFAYDTVFAQTNEFEHLVREHAEVSPVVQTQAIPADDGELLVNQYVWGQRPRKPKWKGSKP